MTEFCLAKSPTERKTGSDDRETSATWLICFLRWSRLFFVIEVTTVDLWCIEL
jgi:hypothetical protein